MRPPPWGPAQRSGVCLNMAEHILRSEFVPAENFLATQRLLFVEVVRNPFPACPPSLVFIIPRAMVKGPLGRDNWSCLIRTSVPVFPYPTFQDLLVLPGCRLRRQGKTSSASTAVPGNTHSEAGCLLSALTLTVAQGENHAAPFPDGRTTALARLRAEPSRHAGASRSLP